MASIEFIAFGAANWTERKDKKRTEIFYLCPVV
jgi:hypothetical protein